MNHLNPRVIVVGLIVTLALAIPLAVFTDYYFYSGQLLQEIGRKLGVTELSQPGLVKEAPVVPAVDDPDLILLPLDAGADDVPDGFEAVEVQVDTAQPAWGDGAAVVTGGSVSAK